MSQRLLFPFIVVLLAACSPSVKEIVEERWEDGSPRTVKYYEEQGDSLALIREVNYYVNGYVRLEGSYHRGKRHGYWVYYYDSGNKWSEGTYVNGVENEMRSVYHPNGNLNYEGMYRMGERIGRWQFYDESGVQVNEIDYGQ